MQGGSASDGNQSFAFAWLQPLAPRAGMIRIAGRLPDDDSRRRSSPSRDVVALPLKPSEFKSREGDVMRDGRRAAVVLGPV